MKPPTHPEPPPDFLERRLPIKKVAGQLIRIHEKSHNPLYFSKSGNNRFDAPKGEFGVLYAGRDEYSAFIETFGSATGVNFVTDEDLEERGMAEIVISRSEPLRLVDLTDEGLARMGADDRLCTGEHAVAQIWSLALYLHPESPDGIWYPTRHDLSRRSAAIFHRARKKIKAVVKLVNSFANPRHQQLLEKLLEYYDFGLV